MFRQIYHCGIPEEPLKIVGDTEETGTTIKFHPDATVFETIDFNYDTLKTLLRELSYLNKGLTLTLEDRREGRQRSDVFCYEGGVVHFIEDINKGKEVLFAKPVYFEDSNGGTDFLKLLFSITTAIQSRFFRSQTISVSPTAARI